MGRKVEETAKGKSVGSLRGTSLCICVGKTCTDRETVGQLQVAGNNWVWRI